MAARSGHKATTANFEAVYPFQVENGLGSRGVYIGRGSYGSAFVYDPWELYQANLLSNPNMVVIGEVGSGKTSLIKTMIYRSSIFRNRRAVVIDPKGEYGNVARALGSEPIKLAPGGNTRLNPLNPRAGDAAQLSLLKAVLAASLARPLRPVEEAAATQALRLTNERAKNARTEPILPDIVRLFLHPTSELAKPLAQTAKELKPSIADAGLALLQLCEGELSGMFDGPSTAEVNFDSRVIVLDLSAVSGSKAIGILMACASAWLQAEIRRQIEQNDITRNLWIDDEGWKVIKHEGIGEWKQESYKLARAYSIANVLVLHRLSDFESAGADGSRAQSLAKGLLADTGTRVVYRQKDTEADRLRNAFDLSDMQLHMALTSRDGEALWMVGNRHFSVYHDLSREERALVNSDAQMGITRAGFTEAALV